MEIRERERVCNYNTINLVFTGYSRV